MDKDASKRNKIHASLLSRPLNAEKPQRSLLKARSRDIIIIYPPRRIHYQTNSMNMFSGN